MENFIIMKVHDATQNKFQKYSLNTHLFFPLVYEEKSMLKKGIIIIMKIINIFVHIIVI
jgi:hypothetical protein